ncbi:MAG: hypothetical protein ACO1TE_22260 [Prosthecobacter sp.]
MFSNHTTSSSLGACLLLAMGGLQAQTPEAPPAAAAAPAPAPASAVEPAPAPAAGTPAADAAPAPATAPAARPDLPTLQAAARDAEAKLPSPTIKTQSYFDLSPAQRERWQQFLPQTLLKLTRRQPLQIVILGDAIMEGAAVGQGTDPLLKSFAGVFAKALASQFFYTGGVRVLRPGSRLRGKESMVLGPEILLQPVRTPSIVSAAAALATVGFQGRPDLVLVAHGLEDGMNHTASADIAAALRSLRDTVRSHKLEMIVAGPVPQAADPEETSLALPRAASSVMRDFCTAEKLLFSDLGDFARLVSPSAGTREAHLLFPALVQQYQSRLNLASAGQVATPSALMHESMGRILFEDVMRGAPAVPWTVSDATAVLEGQGRLKLEFQVTNTHTEELALTLLPLVPAGYRLKEATSDVKLAAGAKQTVKVDYTIIDTRFLPLADGKVRFPVLVIAPKVARIDDLVAVLRPFSAGWNTRAAFNVEKEFSPGVEIENSTGSALAATWESSWAGQKQEGKVSLDANGAETLNLALPLPADDKAPFRQRLPLNFAVSANGTRQIFDRYVEITRNFGLKQAVPLTAVDGQASGVTLRADADGMKLFLTIDLGGVDLVDNNSGQGYELLLNLDARSYGQRMAPGATAAIRITGKAGDGAAQIDEIAPWAFGGGYAAVFEVKEIGATLSSSSNGARRITLSIPKSYLYLHEWALDNGNSQLGINVRLTGGGRQYFLTRGDRQGDDAEGLSVLELTTKPTRRWTVRLE